MKDTITVTVDMTEKLEKAVETLQGFNDGALGLIRDYKERHEKCPVCDCEICTRILSFEIPEMDSKDTVKVMT